MENQLDSSSSSLSNDNDNNGAQRPLETTTATAIDNNGAQRPLETTTATAIDNDINDNNYDPSASMDPFASMSTSHNDGNKKRKQQLTPSGVMEVISQPPPKKKLNDSPTSSHTYKSKVKPDATELAKAKKKMKRALKKERDKDLPSRKLTAYNFFFTKQRASILADNQQGLNIIAVNEIVKTIGVKWKALTRKEMEPFNVLAKDDAERHARERKVYNVKVKLANENMVAEESDDESDEESDESDNDYDSDEENDIIPPPAPKKRGPKPYPATVEAAKKKAADLALGIKKPDGRGRKKKSDTDPNYPVPKLTAFNCYRNSNVHGKGKAALSKGRKGAPPPTENEKLEKWNKLSVKARVPYEQEAKVDGVRYRRELKAYKENLPAVVDLRPKFVKKGEGGGGKVAEAEAEERGGGDALVDVYDGEEEGEDDNDEAGDDENSDSNNEEENLYR